MAVFTEVFAQDLHQHLNKYYADIMLNASNIDLKPIASGTENTNYFLDILQNGQIKRYVLTIFERLSYDDLPFYLNWVAFLHQNQVKVASPIALSHPQFSCQYLSSLYQKPMAISHFLKGKPLKLDSDTNNQANTIIQIKQVAQELAKMHLLSVNYQPKQKNLRGIEWLTKSMHAILPHLDHATEILFQHAYRNEENFLNSKNYAQLPRGIGHCDLFVDNVLFEQTQLSGLIDFYFAAECTFVFDISITINDWCFNHQAHQTYQMNDAAKHFIHQDLMQIFLQAYQTIRPLTDLEQKAMPWAFQSAALRFWTSRLYDWHAPRSSNLYKPHDPKHFQNLVEAYFNEHKFDNI